MDKLVELARSKTVRRAAVGLYVLALAGVIGAFFIISLFEVENSTYLLGHDTIEKGRPNAVRGVVFDTPTGKFVTNARVDLSLYDVEWDPKTSADKLVQQKLEGKAEGQTIASGSTEPTGHIQLQLAAPDTVSPGDYALVVHATGQRVSENYYAGVNIAVEPREPTELDWPTKTHRLAEDSRPDHENAASKSEGPIAIDVLPRDGEVIRGVESTVYVRTYYRDSGEPTRATVRFDKVAGINETDLPARVQTDRMGLARVRWTPGTDQNWDLVVEKAAPPTASDDESPTDDEAGDEESDGESQDSSATIRITTVPAQYSITLKDSVVAPGESVEGYVKSLNRSGGMMVDLYDGDEWTVAEAFGMQEGASGLRIEVPDYGDIGSLQRVQVYGGIYGVGTAWDSEYVWVADDASEQGTSEALREIVSLYADEHDDAYFQYLVDHDAERVETANPKDVSRWMRAYLDGLPDHFDSPPELINTEKAAKERLEAWKNGIKSKLIYLTAFGLFIGMMVVLYFVVIGIRSSQEHQRMLRDVDTDLAIDGDLDEDDRALDDARADDWVVWLQIAIVVTTLIFFAAGILLLLSFM